MADDTSTEITEGDWKTLATTEITHLTDEEKDYLPRAWDEWIARVKRDAAREALDGLAAEVRLEWHERHHWLLQPIDDYRDDSYPETED